ncbi:DUF4376 domain-containing protein [Bradyrhizobium stylosanthis]|uniref:DUF4376 domain-containing protein n=1 Tax=Bradyrhizobium stylosanthis TaxID=1803665 RepID=UPI0007C5D1AE|nr:DUF4376 domain-containing protein [Bradyrhizobium stylosanthis]
MIYDPNDWYWRAGDGRVFASARQQIVDENDAEFLAFKEVQYPTDWPRDDAGGQTDAALQAVVDPYETIFVNEEYYAANRRWLVETGGITSSAGVPLETNDRSKTMIIGAGLAASSDSQLTTTWVGADGNFYPLTNAQMIEQVGDLQRHIDACFVAYTDIVGQLRSGKKLSRKQIDDVFAAAKPRPAPKQKSPSSKK